MKVGGCVCSKLASSMSDPPHPTAATAATASDDGLPPPPGPAALLRQPTAQVIEQYSALPGATPEGAAVAASFIARGNQLDAFDAKKTEAEGIKDLVKEGRLGAAGRHLLEKNAEVRTSMCCARLLVRADLWLSLWSSGIVGIVCALASVFE